MNQLIVALDVDSAGEARTLAGALRGAVGAFKIGSHLFASHGPAIVDELVERGDRLFLDLKFHDIPNTVASAVRAATRRGVWMVDVHASGGSVMLRAARDAAHDEAARIGRPAPLVVGITVLTSLDDVMLQAIGVRGTVVEQVERLADLCQRAGLDGIVASPQEVAAIRRHCGEGFLIVTPGVRGGAAEATKGGDDQQRTMSAPAALAAGASYLVVGRPIILASDPRAAAERIARECAATIRP
jgi:orotidine-5'-phosphate decarboxylase